ncbi:MAG: alpha/beta fold hydrolase, partial [Proteobacteria bacterium]
MHPNIGLKPWFSPDRQPVKKASPMLNFALSKRLAFAFFMIFFGFSFFSPPARAVNWDLGLVTIKRDWVRIPIEPGVELIGTLYQKRGLKVDGPLVILLNPWSIGTWVYGLQANALAEKGFTVLSYNLRGWAGSQGVVDNGGAVDVADVSRVIDWVAQTYHLDVSEVGIGGVSLGAGVALNAAAFEPRIRAVASMSTWTDFYTPIYGNSTKRVFWDAVLWLGSVIGTGSPAAAKLKDTYEAIENADYVQIHAYADPRSPVSFLDRYAVNKPAILLSQNMSDILFPVSDVWTFFERLPVPKKMNLQPGVHATAEITGMFLPFKDKVWGDSIEWFERWLKPNHPSHEVLTSEVQVTLRSGLRFSAESTSDLA